MIFEERRELEEENRALRSLALLTLLEIRKANREVEVLSLERNWLIEDLEALNEHHRLLREKGQKLKGKKTALKRELAGIKEELSRISSECSCRCLKGPQEKLGGAVSALKGLLVLREKREQMVKEQASAARRCLKLISKHFSLVWEIRC